MLFDDHPAVGSDAAVDPATYWTSKLVPQLIFDRLSELNSSPSTILHESLAKRSCPPDVRHGFGRNNGGTKRATKSRRLVTCPLSADGISRGT